MDAEYDYIICGGGTSGCVVAARLSDDTDARILVIEAGSHNKDLENVHMVGGLTNLAMTDHDWKIITTPQAGCDNREIHLFRGRFLGGSSGVNGTLCIRGSKQDYDDWYLPGWSGEEVHDAMKRAETFHSKPWFKPAPGVHGTDGPLHIEPHDLAPISEKVLESFKSQGFPLDHDMFSHGERSFGIGHVPRTIYKGTRSTGADFITKERHRANIDILVNTVVDKVNFDQASELPRARSVDVLSLGGTRTTFTARREVIVSGGTYCSPIILMRSGIGAKGELQRHGIECLVDSPGVGSNLMDHPLVLTMYETEQPGLTLDEYLNHGDVLQESREQWLKEKTGALSIYPFGPFAYARLDERMEDVPEWQSAIGRTGRDPMGLTAKQPNIEFWSIECHMIGSPFPPQNNEQVFGMFTELFSPRSRGSVSLKSKDPLDNPVVDKNYLGDPLDLIVISEGAQWAHEIITQGKGTKDLVKGAWPPHSPHMSYKTREDWEPYVRQTLTTCYHPAGTCKMGKSSDPYAVLDEKLRVRGVTGLRVADCSVMPTLNGGHTQMPAYAIGERCADFIEEARKANGSHA